MSRPCRQEDNIDHIKNNIEKINNNVEILLIEYRENKGIEKYKKRITTLLSVISGIIIGVLTVFIKGK